MKKFLLLAFVFSTISSAFAQVAINKEEKLPIGIGLSSSVITPYALDIEAYVDDFSIRGGVGAYGNSFNLVASARYSFYRDTQYGANGVVQFTKGKYLGFGTEGSYYGAGFGLDILNTLNISVPNYTSFEVTLQTDGTRFFPNFEAGVHFRF